MQNCQPENLLLDAQGHLILTDFGCAKDASLGQGEEGDVDVDAMSATSFTGTEAYMAPEIIELMMLRDTESQEGAAGTGQAEAGRSYGIAVDWWAFGVLLHQMLTGDIPFFANNVKTMRKKILAAKIKFAKFLSPTSVSLLKQLLVADPTRRLGGSRPGGAVRSPGGVAAGALAVRSHSFFEGVCWDAALDKRLPPPFVPSLPSGPMDIGNIDEKYTRGFAAVDSPVSSPALAASGLFSGFSYDGSPTRFNLLAEDDNFVLDGPLLNNEPAPAPEPEPEPMLFTYEAVPSGSTVSAKKQGRKAEQAPSKQPERGQEPAKADQGPGDVDKMRSTGQRGNSNGNGAPNGAGPNGVARGDKARVFSCAAKEWPAQSQRLGVAGAPVIDVRKQLKHANPHHDDSLRPKTGLDQEVEAFIIEKAGQLAFERLVAETVAAAHSAVSVCVVCVGGKHRSVAVAKRAAERLGVEAEHLMLSNTGTGGRATGGGGRARGGNRGGRGRARGGGGNARGWGRGGRPASAPARGGARGAGRGGGRGGARRGRANGRARA